MAGAIVLADSIQEPHIQEIAFQNVLFNLSRDNHHVINLLNSDKGHSPVRICDHSIAAAVIQAFHRKFNFLLL